MQNPRSEKALLRDCFQNITRHKIDKKLDHLLLGSHIKKKSFIDCNLVKMIDSNLIPGKMLLYVLDRTVQENIAPS